MAEADGGHVHIGSRGNLTTILVTEMKGSYRRKLLNEIKRNVIIDGTLLMPLLVALATK